MATKKQSGACPVPALDVAQYVIQKCHGNGGVRNFHLQRILYVLQERCLKELKRPLFVDDCYAFKFGPCFPEVYWRFAGYGASDLQPMAERSGVHKFSVEELKIIDNELDKYQKRNIFACPYPQVVEEGSPWKVAFDRYGAESIVSLEMIAGNGNKEGELHISAEKQRALAAIGFGNISVEEMTHFLTEQFEAQGVRFLGDDNGTACFSIKISAVNEFGNAEITPVIVRLFEPTEKSFGIGSADMAISNRDARQWKAFLEEKGKAVINLKEVLER